MSEQYKYDKDDINYIRRVWFPRFNGKMIYAGECKAHNVNMCQACGHKAAESVAHKQ